MSLVSWLCRLCEAKEKRLRDHHVPWSELLVLTGRSQIRSRHVFELEQLLERCELSAATPARINKEESLT